MRLSKADPTGGYSYLTSGNNGGETYSYDANGNQTGLNYYGSSSVCTWDDEDRLTSITGAGGLNDTFLYNGLGQRTAKTDSTGQYALVSDGTSPAAPVLADGVTVYTPGLSSRKNGYSEFRHGDLLGSLRFLTDANQNVVGDRLFSAFGATVASDGDPSTPFGWVGDGESQTDADTGLVLMGHRVYDSRLGRFLSQDKAQSGTNWYDYADNNPVGEADPLGLLAQPFTEPYGTSEDKIITDTMIQGGNPGETYNVTGNGKTYSFTIPNWYIVQVPGVSFRMAFPSNFSMGSAMTQAKYVKTHTRPVTGNVVRDKFLRKSGRLGWVVGQFATGHVWDFKNNKGIPSYLSKMAEAGGNFAFGAILAELGIPQAEASDGAGGAELVDHFSEAFGNYMNNRKDWSAGAFDNPIDETQIKAGYGWYYGSYGGVQP